MQQNCPMIFDIGYFIINVILPGFFLICKNNILIFRSTYKIAKDKTYQYIFIVIKKIERKNKTILKA